MIDRSGENTACRNWQLNTETGRCLRCRSTGIDHMTKERGEFGKWRYDKSGMICPTCNKDYRNHSENRFDIHMMEGH